MLGFSSTSGWDSQFIHGIHSSSDLLEWDPKLRKDLIFSAIHPSFITTFKSSWPSYSYSITPDRGDKPNDSSWFKYVYVHTIVRTLVNATVHWMCLPRVINNEAHCAFPRSTRWCTNRSQKLLESIFCFFLQQIELISPNHVNKKNAEWPNCSVSLVK